MEIRSNQENSIGLPDSASIYEKEYDYWPWGKLIGFVADWIEKNAPSNACVLDYMCGTGFLLNKLASKRTDIESVGCSITEEYIKYAQHAYSNIRIVLCDALKYEPAREPDIIVCTGGIHHLPREHQKVFVDKVASELSSGKIFIVGEELIRGFHDERTRRFAVTEMLFDLISYIIESDAPAEIMSTASDLLKADLTGQEHKIDMTTIQDILSPDFDIEEQHRLWPDVDKEYGDYVFICRKR